MSITSSDNGTSERKRIEKLIEEVADIYKISEDITTDPFVSPALAPDEMLKGLPPMSLIVRTEKLCISTRVLIVVITYLICYKF